ncbi:MAG: hypothetical protein PHR16_08360 [Methylovulum sp.]|nr:hypothetical protein [Methylovulum sp.]
MEKLGTTHATNAGSKAKQKQHRHFTLTTARIKAIALWLTPFIQAMGAFHV